MKIHSLIFKTVLLGFGLSACATTQPARYADISNAAKMTPNHLKTSKKIPYLYTTEVNWNWYNRAILDPVSVYQAEDNQFGKLSDEDRKVLATFMYQQFGEKLKSRFALVNDAAPHTLRIKSTITGAETNKQVVSTAAHIDLAGNLYNIVQAARSQPAAFSGSVMYSVEIYDSSSNILLAEYIGKEYPNAMDITSSFGRLSASKAGIRLAANTLLSQMR